MTSCFSSRGSLARLALALLVLGVRSADAFSSSAQLSRGAVPICTRTASSSPRSQTTSWRRSHHYTVQQLRVLSQKEEQYVESSVISGGDLEVVSGAPLSAHKDGQDELFKTAVRRTLLWIAAAGMFGAGLFVFVDPQTSEEFFAGYLLEQSLSVDNLLVFLLLFEYFKVPNKESENRVLNWGIIGAICMRAIMIGAGAVAIQQFHAVLLVFAGILMYSSAKVLLGDDDDDEEDLSENQIVQFSHKLISSTDKFDGDRFFTVIDGVRMATPLFLCMVAVEISDVVFAVDSIPAVFGVTENPLVVFTSNMFAIMGLRSLYTILSKAASELKYLEPAVAVILGFIGGKLVLEYFGTEVSTELSLGVVFGLLSLGIGASVYENKQLEGQEEYD